MSIGLPSAWLSSFFQNDPWRSRMSPTQAWPAAFPRCALRQRDSGLITGHDIATQRTVASTAGEPAGSATAA